MLCLLSSLGICLASVLDRRAAECHQFLIEVRLSAFTNQLWLSDQGDFDICLRAINVREKESYIHATSSEVSQLADGQSVCVRALRSNSNIHMCSSKQSVKCTLSSIEKTNYNKERLFLQHQIVVFSLSSPPPTPHFLGEEWISTIKAGDRVVISRMRWILAC
jgi:hypothetical protein